MDGTIEKLKYEAACIYFGSIVAWEMRQVIKDITFKSVYGLSLMQAAVTWDYINAEYILEKGYLMKHLLWALIFLKYTQQMLSWNIPYIHQRQL